MTQHQWIAGADGSLYDPSNYVDGTPFEAGDLLAVDGGDPTAFGTGRALLQLIPGTYDFEIAAEGATQTQVTLGDVELGSSSVIDVEGGSGFYPAPGNLQMNLFGTFDTQGILYVGSSQTEGNIHAVLNADGDGTSPSFVNQGSIRFNDVIPNGGVVSTVWVQPNAQSASFVNATGADIDVGYGNTLLFGDGSGYLASEGYTFRNDGTIEVGLGSTLTVNAAYTGSGTVAIDGVLDGGNQPFQAPNSVAEIGGPASGNFTIADGALVLGDGDTGATASDTGSITFLDDDGQLSLAGGDQPFGMVIHGFQYGDEIVLDRPTNVASFDYDQATDTLTLYDGADDGGDVVARLVIDGNYTTSEFTVSPGSSSTVITVACYCVGTRIATPAGEVAVEALRIGDRLLTASGEARPVRWIGRRGYDGRFAAGNRDVLPIRIAAGALADGVPGRDLLVSPRHAMLLDGILIPAACLVNGRSITRVTRVERVEYVHVELDTHDVILAEGAAAESYVDDDSRAMFHNAHEYHALYPQAVRRPALYCGPRVEEGFALEAVRRRLRARADAMGLSHRQAG